MRLHIDKVSYNQKPKDSITLIKPRVQSNSTLCDADVKQIAEAVRQGRVVSPAVMKGGAKAENWTEQQVFMVDIDNNADEDLAKKLKIDVSQLTEEQRTPILQMDDALKICKANDLFPCIIYESYSHSEEKPKYRLVLVMDEVVKDSEIRKTIIETLVDSFSQSDKSCKNADRIFYGTNKKVRILDEDAKISLESILKVAKPPTPKNEYFTISHGNDDELERLKREFDFFGYLQQRNGETVFNNSTCAMFEHCELCGHKKDLVYYHETNSYKCFGAGNDSGGSIIDYIMNAKRLELKDAIAYFKHDLCGIPVKEFSREEKRDYAIKKRVPANDAIVKKLHELNAYQSYSLNDKGWGELYADVFKDVCRYNVTAKEPYIYEGKRWIEDTGSMYAHRKAKELYNALLVYATSIEDDSQKSNYIDFVNKFGQLKHRETMIKDAREKYFISQAILDSNTDLLNCTNGTLNLKTGEFRPHNADDLLSKNSNVIYDPTAKSPLFEKFINEIMQGDAGKIDYLQRIFGYSLTADTSLETCFILYGATTRNGKGTLMETISYMMGGSGGYAMAMKPETLAMKQNSDSRQASGDIARLKGVRLLNASEPPKRMNFDVALLKTLLGRDTITARHLHEREFEFIPQFKLFINTNFLPLISDDSLFTSGRINVITFDRHFEPHEQDRTLKDRLKSPENISGIFNWCLEGLKKFRESGATPPPAVTTATAEYRTNSDKVGNFISECLERTGKNSKAFDVYMRYKVWCELNGFGTENKGNFFDELRAKNILKNFGTVDGATFKNVVQGYSIIPNSDYLIEKSWDDLKPFYEMD